MDGLFQIWQNQAEAYPHWLVVSSLVIVGAVGLWLLTKMFVWLLKWLLIGAAVCLVVGAVFYWLI
jgi:hypothetical protein